MLSGNYQQSLVNNYSFKVRFGFFVDWRINFHRLFNAKEEKKRYYLNHSLEDKDIYTFPKGICPESERNSVA